MPVVANIEDVLAAIRTRIAAEVPTARPLNRLQREAKTTHYAHLGFHVTRADTANTLNFRDQAVAGGEDSIIITLSYQLKTPDQQAGEALAIAFSRDVRHAICDRSWVNSPPVAQRLRYLAEAQDIEGGFLVFVQNYSYTRQVSLA